MNAHGQELMQLSQQAHGYFVAKTRHAITISDPILRADIQAKLDHSVNLVAIANVMAVFEQSLPKKYWVRVFRDTELTKQLRAFRHIRFSAVNGLTAKRASENSTDFDKLFRPNDLPNWISVLTDSELILNDGAAEYVFRVVKTAYDRGITAVHNI